LLPLLEVGEQACAVLDAPDNEVWQDSRQTVHSDDDVSSEDEEPDVHAFGDETMIDDGAVLLLLNHS
jgi:hypothetical protein